MKIQTLFRPLLVAFCATIVATSALADEKWATASSSKADTPPEAAIDKDKGERWCAAGGGKPQWWMANLGRPREVSGLGLDWWLENATYKFKVEGSANQTDWKLLADKTADGAKKSGPVEMKKESVQWLKITITDVVRDDGADAWASLKAVHLKVTDNGKEAEWKPETP